MKQPSGTDGHGSAEDWATRDRDRGDARWSPIGHEELPWDVESDTSMSRRKRLQARGPYQAAVVPPIAEARPFIGGRTSALAEEATIEMVRFDRDLGEHSAPFSALLLRSESAASSQIENLTAGAKKIVLAQIGDKSSTNATIIASNVAAMRAAVDLSDDVSAENILQIHRALLSGSQPDIAGIFRTQPVWIGGNSPHTAKFVPPRHEAVAPAMEDLVRFMRRDDVPALAQMAISHAHFETIHPFPDGNGRTGRAMVGSLLRSKGITEQVTIPVSSGLLANTDAYFAALNSYQEGDVEPIIGLFADSSFSAMDNGRQLKADIAQVREQYNQLLPQKRSSSLRASMDLIVREPAITADMLIKNSRQSSSTAYRNLEALEAAGILKASSHIRGQKVWIATAVIAALDEFAFRAGRRAR